MSKFKVGQKVRIIKNSYGWNWVQGSSGFIVSVHPPIHSPSLEPYYVVMIDRSTAQPKVSAVRGQGSSASKIYFAESDLLPDGPFTEALL